MTSKCPPCYWLLLTTSSPQREQMSLVILYFVLSPCIHASLYLYLSPLYKYQHTLSPQWLSRALGELTACHPKRRQEYGDSSADLDLYPKQIPSAVYTCRNIVNNSKDGKGGQLEGKSWDYRSVVEYLYCQLQGPRLNPRYWAINEQIDLHLKKNHLSSAYFKYHTSWLFTKQRGAYSLNSCRSLGAVSMAKKSNILIDSPWKVTFTLSGVKSRKHLRVSCIQVLLWNFGTKYIWQFGF